MKQNYYEISIVLCEKQYDLFVEEELTVKQLVCAIVKVYQLDIEVHNPHLKELNSAIVLTALQKLSEYPLQNGLLFYCV